MRSKYIDSTSGRKFVTENGFSDTDFLYDGRILAVRRYFYLFVATFHCACVLSTTFLLPV